MKEQLNAFAVCHKTPQPHYNTVGGSQTTDRVS